MQIFSRSQGVQFYFRNYTKFENENTRRRKDGEMNDVDVKLKLKIEEAGDRGEFIIDTMIKKKTCRKIKWRENKGKKTVFNSAKKKKKKKCSGVVIPIPNPTKQQI